MTDTKHNMVNNENTENEVTTEVVQQTLTELMLEVDEVSKQVMTGQRRLIQIYKEIEKAHKREIRTARKSRKSSRTAGEKKDPSGFNKPQPVPIEFYVQPWGCNADQELPRTVLTKMIYDYIKENELQAEEDKRVINPDETLRKLFHLKKTDTLEFKNFQTYMARLYKRTFDEDDEWSAQASDSSVTEDEDEEIIEIKTKSKKTKKSKSVSAAI